MGLRKAAEAVAQAIIKPILKLCKYQKDNETAVQFERRQEPKFFLKLENRIWADLCRITQPGMQPLVLLYLCRWSWALGEDWTPELPLEAIAQVLHCEVRTVYEAIKELHARKLLAGRPGLKTVRMKPLAIERWPQIEDYRAWEQRERDRRALEAEEETPPLPPEDGESEHDPSAFRYLDKKFRTVTAAEPQKTELDGGAKDVEVSTEEGLYIEHRIAMQGGTVKVILRANPHSRKINELQAKSDTRVYERPDRAVHSDGLDSSDWRKDKTLTARDRRRLEAREILSGKAIVR